MIAQDKKKRWEKLLEMTFPRNRALESTPGVGAAEESSSYIQGEVNPILEQNTLHRQNQRSRRAGGHWVCSPSPRGHPCWPRSRAKLAAHRINLAMKGISSMLYKELQTLEHPTTKSPKHLNHGIFQKNQRLVHCPGRGSLHSSLASWGQTPDYTI